MITLDVSKGYGLYPRWDRFLSSLRESFAFLAGVPLEEAPMASKWKEWREIFGAHKKHVVWTSWYDDCGCLFLPQLTERAVLLEFFGEGALRQATYNLDEVNQSGDYEYILDIVADTIEWLDKRVKSLEKNLEKEEFEINLTSSQGTGFFYEGGKFFYGKRRLYKRARGIYISSRYRANGKF